MAEMGGSALGGGGGENGGSNHQMSSKECVLRIGTIGLPDAVTVAILEWSDLGEPPSPTATHHSPRSHHLAPRNCTPRGHTPLSSHGRHRVRQLL